MSQHSSLCRDTNQADGGGILSRHLTTLSRLKEIKISNELYRDKRNLYRDKKWKNNEIGQDNAHATEFFILL